MRRALAVLMLTEENWGAAWLDPAIFEDIPAVDVGFRAVVDEDSKAFFANPPNRKSAFSVGSDSFDARVTTLGGVSNGDQDLHALGGSGRGPARIVDSNGSVSRMVLSWAPAWRFILNSAPGTRIRARETPMFRAFARFAAGEESGAGLVVAEHRRRRMRRGRGPDRRPFLVVKQEKLLERCRGASRLPSDASVPRESTGDYRAWTRRMAERAAPVGNTAWPFPSAPVEIVVVVAVQAVRASLAS